MINNNVCRGWFIILVPTLSYFLNQKVQICLKTYNDYYHGLQGVSQRGNWTYWIMFMLSTIEQTSTTTFNKINDIVNAKESILDYIKAEKKKLQDPENLINQIFTQPFTKVKHLVDAGIYSENTARDYLNRLAAMSVLEKKILEGHHYNLNSELYNILGE